MVKMHFFLDIAGQVWLNLPALDAKRVESEVAVPKFLASLEQGVVRKAARRIYMRQGGFMSCIREHIY